MHWRSLEEVLHGEARMCCTGALRAALSLLTLVAKSEAVIRTRLKSVQRCENCPCAVINGLYSAAYVRPG